jgi:hypothetical protein|tara:strand:- start:5186 stop:5302 length:117 start_codon:yes stop_codon:yes gene_type:complete
MDLSAQFVGPPECKKRIKVVGYCKIKAIQRLAALPAVV